MYTQDLLAQRYESSWVQIQNESLDNLPDVQKLVLDIKKKDQIQSDSRCAEANTDKSPTMFYCSVCDAHRRRVCLDPLGYETC